MMIKIDDLVIYVYSDGPNPATYDLRQEHMNQNISLQQDKMELLVANLQVLVNQNKNVVK